MTTQSESKLLNTTKSLEYFYGKISNEENCFPGEFIRVS